MSTLERFVPIQEGSLEHRCILAGDNLKEHLALKALLMIRYQLAKFEIGEPPLIDLLSKEKMDEMFEARALERYVGTDLFDTGVEFIHQHPELDRLGREEFYEAVKQLLSGGRKTPKQPDLEMDRR